MATILIIEDNQKNMKLLRDLLRHQGHATLEAACGFDGVRLAEEHRPDLVLMDILLPDIDGIEALRRIHALPGLNSVPVIAVSASVMPDDQQRIAAAGFDAYVIKPISVRGFLDTVGKILAEGSGS
jgi:two-component system, cell cycle response regulator DivK